MDSIGSCSPLHSKLTLFRSTEKYCDVKIQVQDISFPCHRVVLASGSEYFDALFGGSFMEKDACVTVLHDIDVETFKEILTCLYTGTAEMCTITASNVSNLLSASLFLMIHSLEKACTKFILENVSSIQNHIWILVLARSLNITTLVDVITEHVILNFKSFYNNEALLEMSFDDLSFLLDRWCKSKLPFKFEDLLLHFLIHWVQCGSGERRAHFANLIADMDLERFSPNYITFMMQCYIRDFFGQPSLEGMPPLNLRPVMQMEESKSTVSLFVENSHNDIENSQNKLCVKRELFKCLTRKRKLSATCGEEMPVPFHDPNNTFYKNILGLHVYVEYASIGRHDREKDYFTRRSEGFKVLSANKYNPDWFFVSCEMDGQRRCIQRRTIVQQSTNLLYSMDIFSDVVNDANLGQKFCSYTSTDFKLASSVLTPPPIPLQNKNCFDMCTTSENDIYLVNFLGIGIWSGSLEETGKGFYCYNREVDKWFPAPKMKTAQKFSSICADHNLIYSIGGINHRCTFQAFDYRSGKWMTLPECIGRDHEHPESNSCVLQDKVFVSSGPSYAHSYDTIAGKWESICPPKSCRRDERNIKMVSYDNKLCLLYNSCHDPQNHYTFATYTSSTQEWYLHKGFDHVISKGKPNRTDGEFTYEWYVSDMITFKT